MNKRINTLLMESVHWICGKVANFTESFREFQNISKQLNAIVTLSAATSTLSQRDPTVEINVRKPMRTREMPVEQ